MSLTTDPDGRASLTCSRLALGAFGQALNEEVNGLGIVDSSLAATGWSEDELDRLLERFISVYRALPKASMRRPWILPFQRASKVIENQDNQETTVDVAVKELHILLWTIDDVMNRLEDSEFSTRMGITKEEMVEIGRGLRGLVFDRNSA